MKTESGKGKRLQIAILLLFVLFIATSIFLDGKINRLKTIRENYEVYSLTKDYNISCRTLHLVIAQQTFFYVDFLRAQYTEVGYDKSGREVSRSKKKVYFDRADITNEYVAYCSSGICNMTFSRYMSPELELTFAKECLK